MYRSSLKLCLCWHPGGHPNQPAICVITREEFLSAKFSVYSLLAPFLSCFHLTPELLGSSRRTWELNHIVKGSCQTRAQKQSSVGGINVGGLVSA